MVTAFAPFLAGTLFCEGCFIMTSKHISLYWLVFRLIHCLQNVSSEVGWSERHNIL